MKRLWLRGIRTEASVAGAGSWPSAAFTDIVIRITPAGHRSLVDIRSVSRVGRSDAGTNAKRIRLFMQHLSGAG